METGKKHVWLSSKGTPITTTWEVAEAFGRRHANLTKCIRTIFSNRPDAASMHFYEQDIQANGMRITRGFVMDETGFEQVVAKMTNKTSITGVWQMFRDEFAAVANKGDENAQNAEKTANGCADMPAETHNEPSPMSIADMLRAIADEFESFMADVTTQLDELKHRMDAMAERRPVMKEITPVGDAISVNELAKMMAAYGIKTGELRLYDWLRQNGYLCAAGYDYNLPTQKAAEMGLFVVVPGSYIKPGGQVVKTRTTRVTKKGQIYFVNKFVYNGNNF